MIAEPATSSSSHQNENATMKADPSESLSHTEAAARGENRHKSTPQGRKRAREGSENSKRRHAKVGRPSLGRAMNGRMKPAAVEAVTLFEVVAMGRSAMEGVVDDWIDAYGMDRDTALLDLINFFIQCSGCTGLVTAEMSHNRQDSDVKSKMMEEVDEGLGLQYKKFLAFPWILTVTWPLDTDGGEYPLTRPGLCGRKFRSDFCQFVAVWVSRCQHTVIFHNYLMDSLISLLAELSDSHVRAFRHTCTLAAVKLQSALAEVAQSLSVGLENSQRLSEDPTKTPTPRASARLERKITELQDRKKIIEDMMLVIYNAVFQKRYKDVLPEIRATCMEELAAWIRLYSSMFMADNYLKYMGWTLHDKVADVRLRCVVGLQGVYGDPLLLPKLDLFTARFKKRLISMTMDKDHEVAVQTVKLLILISQSRSQDVLMTEDYEQMFNLVYSSQRPLAAAAGELLYTRVLSSPASLTPDPQDPGRANEEESNTQLTSARLKALLSFHKDNIHHQHIVYLVDSLWDCAGDLLKDWPSLTAVLLEDPVTQETEAESSTLQQVVPQTATPGLSEEVHQTATPGLSEEVPRTSTPEVPQTAPPSGLTEDERALVVELMVASVRQAAEGCALPGRSSGKKSQPQPVSGYEKRIKEEDCCRLTEFFLQALPRLLSKFFNSPDSLACLMKIPQYFYAAPSSDTSGEVLSDLLAEMEVVVERYADPEVLDEAARSYLTLCGETTPWRVLALPARDNLVRLWTGRLAPWLGGAQEGGLSTADEEKTAEILDTLRKLTIFYSGHDLSSWGLYEKLCPLLSIDSTPEVPAQVIVDVLQCVSYSLLWNLNTSEETITCRAEAVAQRSTLGVFCERCLRCLSHEDELVKEQAFLSLCDVLTAHSYQGYPCLPYAPAPELRRALLVFIEEHVFTPSEHSGDDMEGLEVLHRRRNSLAAFCKLIVHGVLEMSMAAEVFKYYTKYYTDYGDIIKETLSKTRQMDKMESARTLMLCLQNLFLELKGWQDSVEPSGSFEGQTFPAIKELARRFSLTFGWEQSKSRQSLTMIHRDGIEFVFKDFVQNPEEHWLSPPNLRYLTILSEFSSKLLRPDKKTVETYLQRYVGEQVSTAGDDWQPLRYYEGSLLAFRDGDDAPYVISDKEQSYRSQTSTIGRPRKQPASSSEGRKAEASSNASQEVDVATAEVGAAEVGAPEVGAPEVSAVEVDAVEANVPEVVAAEVVAAEVGATEVIGPEVVAAEVVAAEVVGPEVVGPEVGAAEVGTLEVDTMEVDTVGVETVQVDL